VGEHKSAGEHRDDCIRLMGQELGEVYAALWQELSWAYRNWREYVVLFGHDEERVELLNAAAPGFFRIVQDTLYEAVVLHIARLTDRPNPGGKPVLSVTRLPSLLSDANLRGDISGLLGEVDAKVAFCRDLRNRHIAHRDLSLATQQSADSLSAGSRRQVADALHALAGVLNKVSLHFDSSETAFDVDTMIGGASLLVDVVREGVAVRNAEFERLFGPGGVA